MTVWPKRERPAERAENGQRTSVISLSTVLCTSLSVALVLIPLLGSVMLPTGLAIAAAVAAGLALLVLGFLLE
jgi:VIT1/CCC1 family predicted Fe2+/Mn2+ transporter